MQSFLKYNVILSMKSLTNMSVMKTRATAAVAIETFTASALLQQAANSAVECSVFIASQQRHRRYNFHVQ